MRLRDPRAGVLDRELHDAVAVRGAELHARPGGAVLDRVVDQVRQHLLERALIGLDRLHAGRDVRRELDPFPLGALAKQAEDQVRDDREIDLLPLQLELVRLEARQLEEILDQVLQALRVSDDDVGEPLGRLRIWVLERGVTERLGGGADGGDGGPQLVRDVGDEVAAQRLESAQIGHVDEHREDAPRLAGERGGVNQEASRLDAGEVELSRDRRAPRARPLDDVVQLGVPHGLDEELADVARSEEQHLAKRRVHEQDAVGRDRGRAPLPSCRRGSAPGDRARPGARRGSTRGSPRAGRARARGRRARRRPRNGRAR